MAGIGHNPAEGFEPKTSREWHIKFVYLDPDFVAEFKDVQAKESDGVSPEVSAALREKLARKYRIKRSDVNLYDLSQTLPLWNSDKSSCCLSVDPNTKEWSFKFNPATLTRVELMEEFKKFEEIRRLKFPVTEQKYRSAPGNPRLIYCIFKARQSGLRYKEIYELYSAGQLEGYKGSTDQHGDEFALKLYYHRYRPK